MPIGVSCKMKEDKSPGWDGIIVEFFKEFWQDLSDSVIAITNKAFTKGRMEESMSKGLIKPIHK